MEAPSNQINCRQATPADKEDIREALGRFFYPEEPVTFSYYNGSAVTDDDMEFALALIDEGFVILAIEENTGRIVGLSAGELVESGEAQHLTQLASTVATKKFADILLFLAHMCKGADIFQRFGVAKAYHIHYLAVDPNARGRSIGQMLMEKQFEQARCCEVKLASTDATGLYSSKLFEKLGMECVYTVAYKDYRVQPDQQVFISKEPHVEAKTMVKHIVL